MKKGERADYILSELKRLYPNPAVPLDHFDTYSLLVAVLLSAQTTDKMVNQVTPDLWKLGKTPAEMAKRKPGEIRETIKRCGLSPQKSIAIQKLSEILVQEYDGQVPDSLEELEKLPGVGHKTASVVMCQAFGQNAFPVDTHIHRLAQRWGLTCGTSVVQTERDLKKLFPEESWNKLHLQIIYYGREYCTARGCNGTVCPICKTLYPRRKTPVETRK
jgi:endonuclease III